MRIGKYWTRFLAMIGLVSAMSAQAGDWRFPVGLSYISGFSDVVDYYDEIIGGDSTVIPVGLSFTPYYEFDHGSRLGFDLGPAGILFIDESDEDDSASVEYWDVPLALSYGFSFIPKAPVTPYARVGIKYHIVGGDLTEESTPGLFGAVGVEFLRKRMIGVGLEIGYDDSEVTFDDGDESEEIKTGQLLVSLRAIF